MSVTYFLDCSVRRLSVRTSRGCARPYDLDGASTDQFVRLCAVGASRPGEPGSLFLLHLLPHTHDIVLTPHFKTLQSP